MSNTLNNEFEKRVKTLVEGLGYALDVEFDSTDKKAYLIPISNLNNAEFLEMREKVRPYVVICFNPISEDISEKELALVFFDDTQENRGVVKLIDVAFPLNADSIPCIQNLVFHHAFPKGGRLEYDINEGAMDYISDHWDDLVKIISFTKLENNNYSWLPSDYRYDLPEKEGFELKGLDGLFTTMLGDAYQQLQHIQSVLGVPHKKGSFVGRIVLSEDLKTSQVDYKLVANDIPSDRESEGEYYEIADKEVIVVSLLGNLKPTLVDAKGSVIYVPLSEMAVFDVDMQDEFDAEYLVKELQKDYVTRQIEDKLRGVMDDKSYILNLIKVYVPLGSNGLSSIERQKQCVQKDQKAYVKYLEEELEKERSKYLKNYKDILNYCKEESLKRLLVKLEKDEITDDSTIFNEVRQLLEWIKQNSSDYKELTLNEFSREQKNIGAPDYVQRSFHTCVEICNSRSHYHHRVGTPYLAKSVVYCLLNILYWYKDSNNN